MSKNRIKFAEVLAKLGFSGPFEFYFWRNDGWYVSCKEMGHIWIGHNTRHVFERLEEQGYQYTEKYLK